MFPEDIGELLKNLRQNLGKDQKTVAEKAGISQATLSYIENKKRNPSIETLRDIIKALGADLNIVYLQAVKEPDNRNGFVEKAFKAGRAGN